MNYDRIILELLDRVSVLEDEVSSLKGNNINKDIRNDNMVNRTITTAVISNSGKDTSKYILDGKKYGKNRLVLAVVNKYMEMNPNISAIQLMTTFDKSLQGSLGVVRTYEDVKENCSDYKTRFFARPEEVIHTSTDDCVVCSQWGIANIGNIVARAKDLGIKITIVK